jgi:hypothetical protein
MPSSRHLRAQLLTEAATDLGGEAPPTARAIKERLSKIRELIKQSGGSTSISAPTGKRGRVKKNTSPKSTSASGTKAPARSRKTKQQGTATVKQEQESLDAADQDDELDELLNLPQYKTHAPDVELTDIPEYPALAPDAEEGVPSPHNNPDEFDKEA